MEKIKWAFMEKDAEIEGFLSEDVAYSWTCGLKDDPDHTHVIECLWVWHDCDLNLNPVPDHWTHRYKGWQPTNVSLHDLISVDPLHIEASVYWTACCGMHGWIREGKWVSV